MESKAKVYMFNPQIYPRLLWISITTESEIDGFDKLSEMDDSYYAVVDNAKYNKDNKGGIMIRFSSLDAMTYENITHESCHAAMEIIRYIEGSVDLDNQEFFCYLAGWVAKCCCEVLELEKKY